MNALKLNMWNHVAVTWDGSPTANNVHIYVNGIESTYQLSTSGFGTRATDTISKLYIGNNQSNTSGWAGNIDQVRIYNQILSIQEINALASE